MNLDRDKTPFILTPIFQDRIPFMRTFRIIALFVFLTASIGWAQTPDPAPAPAGENAAPALPPVPVIARTAVEPSSCSVGGRLRYSIELTWTAPIGREVAIKPFDPPSAQGLDAAHRSQKSGKAVKSGQVETTLALSVVYECASPGKFQLGPLTIPYSDGSAENLSTVAPALNVEVRPGALSQLRSSKKTQYGAFFGGIAVFWIIVLLMRRRRRPKPLPVSGVQGLDAAAAASSIWDNLAAQAREKPDGVFYSELEDALWRELFQGAPIVAGTTATRFAELTRIGLPESVLGSAREVVNACQKARFTSGALSQGDAIEILRAAREKVVDKLRKTETGSA
jgi:hypothetical protein